MPRLCPDALRPELGTPQVLGKTLTPEGTYLPAMGGRAPPSQTGAPTGQLQPCLPSFRRDPPPIASILRTPTTHHMCPQETCHPLSFSRTKAREPSLSLTSAFPSPVLSQSPLPMALPRPLCPGLTSPWPQRGYHGSLDFRPCHLNSALKHR